MLCAQDTTELDFTRPQQQVAGAGPLDASNRRGALLYWNEAFSFDGTPLGAIDAKIGTRDEPDPNPPQRSAEDKRKQRRVLPIEENESMRWLEGIRATQKLAQQPANANLPRPASKRSGKVCNAPATSPGHGTPSNLEQQ